MSGTTSQLLIGDLVTPLPTYATWNPADINANITLSNGNLTAALTSSSNASGRSTIGKSSGKWYWEYTFGAGTRGVTAPGVAKSTATLSGVIGQADANGWEYDADGHIYNNNASALTVATVTNSDTIGVALDADGGTVTWYKNNVSQGSTSVSGTIYAAVGFLTISGSSVTANFGASAMAYTAPSGYNQGLYS